MAFGVASCLEIQTALVLRWHPRCVRIDDNWDRAATSWIQISRQTTASDTLTVCAYVSSYKLPKKTASWTLPILLSLSRCGFPRSNSRNRWDSPCSISYRFLTPTSRYTCLVQVGSHSQSHALCTRQLEGKTSNCNFNANLVLLWRYPFHEFPGYHGPLRANSTILRLRTSYYHIFLYMGSI